MSALTIERIDVGDTSLEAFVRVDPALERTSAAPGLAHRALALLPGLARHTCENGTAHGIIAELADTETPHLLEHIAVELMALAGSPRTLRAETRWDFARDGAYTYRVSLTFDDDLVALGALRDAAAIVEWLLAPASAAPTPPAPASATAPPPAPDVPALVERLRALRTREA